MLWLFSQATDANAGAVANGGDDVGKQGGDENSNKKGNKDGAREGGEVVGGKDGDADEHDSVGGGGDEGDDGGDKEKSDAPLPRIVSGLGVNNCCVTGGTVDARVKTHPEGYRGRAGKWIWRGMGGMYAASPNRT